MREPCDVSGDRAMRAADERRPMLRWFLREHVKTGRIDFAGFQRIRERLLIDQLPARRVDKDRRLLHLL